MPNKYLDLLIARYPQLEGVRGSISLAFSTIEESYVNGGKLLVAGNGGSAADAEHIVGELMKAFVKSRKIDNKVAQALKEIDPEKGQMLSENLQGALPAIALSGHVALTTAYMNDCQPLLAFAQQVNGYGRKGDVFLAISTSGNSENIIFATITAKALGLKTIALTGANESKLSHLTDVAIHVPETETYMVQELHLPIYHCLSLMLEERFF